LGLWRKKDFLEIIIPHFNNYPLFCGKLHALQLLKQIIESLNNKEHKTKEGLIKITSLALSMNLGTFRKPERIEDIYNGIGLEKGASLPFLPNLNTSIDTPLKDDFIAGVIDGDGSFWVSFQQDGRIKTGFSITVDTSSIPLLLKIKERLNNIGSIQKKKETYSYYYIHGNNQILSTLIPFMDKNLLFSERSLHYNIFRKVSIILGTIKPLRLEDKLEIVELAYNANKKGKRRHLSKEEYIDLLYKLHLKK